MKTDHNITMVERPLMDGSKVYDVHVPAMELAAVSEKDAVILSANMAALIRDHTNAVAEWRLQQA